MTASTVMASFWDIETSGQSSSAGGEGKTTAEMQTESTFTDAGWDFVGESVNGTDDIWDIYDGTNYPRLAWQISIPGDFICPDGVNFVDFAILALSWMSEPGDPEWNSACDISQPKDNVIDERDLAVFCENWLKGTVP